jgi:uncharacterized repeat protein (TIGR01451 family)
VTIASPEVIYVQPGDALTYEISYTNTGNQDATGVILSAVLPEHTVFDADNSNGAWTYDVISDSYQAMIGNLAVGTGGSLAFAVNVSNTSAPGLETITLAASIADDGANGADPTPGDNQAEASLPYSEAPDLKLNKTGPGTTQPGAVLVYTLTYANLGYSAATGVVITETLPANTSFNAAESDPAWVQVGTTDQYTYTISSLAKGVSGEVTFAVTVDSPIPDGVNAISNTATIGDDGTHGSDPDPDNNTANADSLFSTGPTNVSGTISVDTTWTPDESPYIVTGTVTVSAGVTLTILPGTVVKFNATSHSLIVNGTLLAQGTATGPITFTSIKDDSVGGDTNADGDATSPAPGDWTSIQVNDTGTASFAYSNIRYGGTAPPIMVTCI